MVQSCLFRTIQIGSEISAVWQPKWPKTSLQHSCLDLDVSFTTQRSLLIVIPTIVGSAPLLVLPHHFQLVPSDTEINWDPQFLPLRHVTASFWAVLPVLCLEGMAMRRDAPLQRCASDIWIDFSESPTMQMKASMRLYDLYDTSSQKCGLIRFVKFELEILSCMGSHVHPLECCSIWQKTCRMTFGQD